MEPAAGGWFDKIGIRTEAIGLPQVGRLLGRGQDDYDDASRILPLAQPCKHVETFLSGHLEIQKYQPRPRKGCSVAELACAGQVIDGFQAVFGNEDGIGDVGGFQRPLHEEDVVFTVIDQENWLRERHLLF